MNKPIHPAVAAHVIEENERLRGLLTQALEFTESNTCGGPDVAQLIAEMRAALSQQAEPAPAQDERAIDTAPLLNFIFSEYGSPEMASNLPDDVVRVVRALEAGTRPAQTEQQPVSWQFYQDGKWWNGDDRIKDHRKNTEAAGIPVRDLYAAPIAQTAPQPEQSGRNEYMPLELIGILQRYKRDLELRTFLDNDEGDYQLRWTAKEIARVSAALSAQGESHE